MDTLSSEYDVELQPVKLRLTRDILEAAKTLGTQEARYLVDSYYIMQENRIREGHRIRIMMGGVAVNGNGQDEDDEEVAAEVEETTAEKVLKPEPHKVIAFFREQNATLEDKIKTVLGRFAKAHPVGQWSLGQTGIGPVIAAGLLAHLDPTYPAAGHIFSFCGLDPTVKWNKGEKRPWSHAAKQIAYKIGDSMVKQSNNPKCLYGAIYRARKEVEKRRNESGAYAEIAKDTLLDRKKLSAEQKKHYEAGRLPPGRIDLRARRVAVKLFLSHWHTVAFWHSTGMMPAAPYALSHTAHAHYIAPLDFDPETFPVADPVRPPRTANLADTIAKYAKRKLSIIDNIEEAAEVIRSAA